MRDYLVVADTGGQVLALSEVTRTLPADALERLTAPLDTARFERHSGTLALGARRRHVRFLAVPVQGAGPGVGGILVATPTRRPRSDPPICCDPCCSLRR